MELVCIYHTCPQVELTTKQHSQKSGFLIELFDADTGDQGRVAKAHKRSGNEGLLKEYMSESVSVVDQSEEFHELILLEVQLNLEHVLLRLSQHITHQIQSVRNRNRRVRLASGNFYIPGGNLLAEPLNFLAKRVI